MLFKIKYLNQLLLFKEKFMKKNAKIVFFILYVYWTFHIMHIQKKIGYLGQFIQLQDVVKLLLGEE